MRPDTHPDADDLVLVAIGEPADSVMLAHLAECDICAAEVARWQLTADTARQADIAGWQPEPPARIWDAVAAELGFTEHDPQATSRRPNLTVVDQPSRSDGPAEPQPAVARPTARPGRRWAVLLAAAVAGAVIGGGAVYALRDRGPAATVELTAELLGLPSGQPQVSPDQRVGDAQLLAVTGGQELKVEVAGLPPIPGAYEVWLIADDQKMVSLGVLADGTGTFTVPAGVDPAVYKIVDISNEPTDGNPTHSTNSIARGSLS